jgi:hypothetical protein
MNAFVVSGLVKRRAELAGKIERTPEQLRKMVDATSPTRSHAAALPPRSYCSA